MTHLWPLLAFVFSLWGAVIIGYNQWARMESGRLMVLRAVGLLPLAFASMAVGDWPTDGGFYVMAGLMGVVLSYGDYLLFKAASEHGGRLTALYVPMKMIFAFTLWALFVPESLLPLLLEPWKLGVLVLGFGLCSGALMFIRRVDASWIALLAVVPVALLYAVADVVSKEAMGAVTVEGGLLQVAVRACAFLAVTSTVGSVGSLLLDGRFWPTRREVALGVLFGVVFLTGLCLLLVTIALAPNPGYVAAITMLSALWLALYGWWQRGERNNWWAGIVLVIGAMAVAVAAG